MSPSLSPAPATIYALSSGRLPAAIAVVRISGPQAGDALKALCGKLPEPRRAALARVRDPRSGEIIDEALALWFPAPKSETGEDVAELQLHGGRAVLAGVCDALGSLDGLRPAEAGEFTRRAFANGYLDLTEVEGLADLIGAETQAQRRQAFRHMKGLLGDKAEDWRRRLIEALALIEAGIDFSDEDLPGNLLPEVRVKAQALVDEIGAALDDGHRGERLRDGLVVAIAGPPNAGKSTLLNRLARREAAIVSPTPGTTRDIIEVQLDLDGCPVTVLDTAGIRETDDPVELEGVNRARARAASADLVLWVVDAADAEAAGGWDADRPASAYGSAVGSPEVGGLGGDRATRRDTGSAAAPDAAGLTGSDWARPAAPGGGPSNGSKASPPVWLVRNKVDLLPEGFPDLPDPPLEREGGFVTSSESGTEVLDHLETVSGNSPVGMALRADVSGHFPDHVPDHPDDVPDHSPRHAPGQSVATPLIGSVATRPTFAVASRPATTPTGSTPKSSSLASASNNESKIEKYNIIYGISACNGRGVDSLLKALTVCAAGQLGGEPALITRARHRQALTQTHDALIRALQASQDDLIAEELRLAARALGRLTGRVGIEDILDVIFRDFCIGK